LNFKLPFDKKTYLQQTQLGIPIIHSELIRRRRNSLISGLFFTALGTTILFRKGDIGVIFVLIGVISFFDCYLKNQKYTEFKNNIMSATKNHLKNDQYVPQFGVFDFNDDYVIYMDEIMCSKTKWSEFEDYKLVKSNLFLIRKKVDGDMLVLGKNEIGEMNFIKLIELTKSKIK